MNKKIGLIIVLYNQKRFLKVLFKSLKEQTEKDFKVYLIDNNSLDNTDIEWKEHINSYNLDLIYTRLNANTGYAAGTNIGAKQAIRDGCKYLFILNSDVYLDKDCINSLVKIMESDENIACSGPLILRHYKNNPELIQEYGGKINYKLASIHKLYADKNVIDVDLPPVLETDFISGGACMIRSNIFQKAGMLEEAYFAYFDEIDLFYRIKSLDKYKMLVTSKAILWHNHDWSSANPKAYYIEYYLAERNKFLYLYKFRLYNFVLINLFLDIIKFPVRLLWFKKVCDFKLGFYYLKGMVHGLLNNKGKPDFIP
ncbi:MAG: glycosyltransferase family 2 protein [Ignavibacteria bacterium]|jgi:GT2 family glycosyltransferase